jgi:signal transduction histidine kinase
MGTLGGGLARLKNGRIANITKRQGLIDNIIVQILPDDLGHFWLGSSHGIMRLERKELDDCADGKLGYVHAAVLGQDDGMLSEQCTGDHAPTAVKTKDGRLLFPTTRGLVEIDPRRWEEPTAQMTEASIEEILVDGRSQRRPGTTVLPPGVRRLELIYTAPSLQGVEWVRFRHRLQPLDEDWINVGTRRTASYGNLGPGKYTFQVTACDNNGAWGANAASLAFTVLPHYWETVWFRVGTGLLLVGLGAAGVGFWSRSRVRRAGERERAASHIRELAGRLIDAQEQERARLARELHDDITQRLARLAIDVGRCELGTAEVSPAETARGVREGLVELSEDVHALSYRLHPSILEDLGLAAALRAESEHFTRQESVPVDVKLREIPEEIPGEPALCLFRVAQEALRNIARHARARVVELSLRGLDGGLQLAVRDDGCGFDPAGPRTRASLGLVSMGERVRSLGGELDIESAPGHGTTVLAWVPMKGKKA